MNGNKVRLVAFDWNGTILSDTKLCFEAEKVIMDHLGLPGHTPKRQKDYFQIPIKDYWISLGYKSEDFDKHSKTIHKMFLDYYEPREKYCRTRSGVREIADWCHKNGIKCVIFSNHIIPHIERQLVRLKIDKYFDKILARTFGDETHMHSKHKDAKLYDYVQSLKLDSQEVITVGDTTEEIEIGKKFGYRTVALTGGNQSNKRLKEAEPDFLIHNLVDLKKIIQNI